MLRTHREVFYSDKRAIVHATLNRQTLPPSNAGTATIFYTLIGDDGTPTSAWQYYALTFSQ